MERRQNNPQVVFISILCILKKIISISNLYRNYIIYFFIHLLYLIQKYCHTCDKVVQGNLFRHLRKMHDHQNRGGFWNKVNVQAGRAEPPSYGVNTGRTGHLRQIALGVADQRKHDAMPLSKENLFDILAFDIMNARKVVQARLRTLGVPEHFLRKVFICASKTGFLLANEKIKK